MKQKKRYIYRIVDKSLNFWNEKLSNREERIIKYRRKYA